MKLIFFFLLSLNLSLFAQQDAWVYLNDKPMSSFYLANPLEMLSQKTINKRLSKGILLDIKDVPVHLPYIASVEQSPGIQVMAQSKWLNALHVRGNLAQIQALSNLDFVDSIEFANKSLNSRSIPSEAQISVSIIKNLELANSNFNYGNASNQIQMLQGHLLHQENFTGEGMTIAVMDNGFQGVNTAGGFQRLWSENLIGDIYNYVQRNTQVFAEGTHGTRVLSNMAGFSQNQFIGTAPDAQYLLYVTESNTYENPLEESLWVEAAERADSIGVDVINTSLGYFTFDNPNYNHSYADFDGQTTFMARGTNVASSRGILCVAAAGNSGNTTTPFVATPGDALGSFTIGAVTANGNYASFSSFGPTTDGRIKPDVVTQGFLAAVINQQNLVTTASGTSFSAPILSGLIACLWQALPSLSVTQLQNLVRSNASLSSNPNQQMGYGIPNFYQAYQNGINLSVSNEVNQSITVFPNPFHNLLKLHSRNIFNQENIEFILYNSLGKKVYHQKINPNQWYDFNALSSGLYFYHIKGINYFEQGKVIKN